MNIFSWLRFNAVADNQRSLPIKSSRPVKRETVVILLRQAPAVDALLVGKMQETSRAWSENCEGFSRAALNGGNVKVLSREKCHVLAEKNGWSLEWARGYVDGEASRHRAKKPSPYAVVGIDEYSLGFRAAYYERRNGASKAVLSSGSEGQAVEEV